MESNPFQRIARFFNPSLSRMESRLEWIEQRIATMPEYHEHPLRIGIGGRGHRATADSPDPVVRLDLGAEHAIDRIFLIPAQREYIGDVGIFPTRFTLESATRDDFADAKLIFTSRDELFPNPEGRPISFDGRKIPTRYLRLTVHSGHSNKGLIDLFGFAEIVTIANNDVVSFGAKVGIDGGVAPGSIWYPEALVDGRMPYGVWHNGLASDDRGDATMIGEGSPEVTWSLRMRDAAPVDRLVLFPYKLTTSFETSLVPNQLHVEILDHENDHWREVASWENQPGNSSCLTPLVIGLDGAVARSVRITATDPWVLGDVKIQGLSEIQVWSGARNVARGLPVTRTRDQAQEVVMSLTNGFTSEHMIADIAVWLDQLRERLRLEKELTTLKPQVRAKAAESELIATMAAAIFISVVFLIPVFYVEHRRNIIARRLDILRKRIASDLHDDIGGNLGSISLIARTARKDLEKLAAPAELTRDLEEVELIARESSLAMRDIIWLVERRHDSVGDLVHRMRQMSGRLLRGIDYSFVCQSSLTDSRLSLNCKRNLFLFFKEALHNIRKHAGANKVTILLDDDRGRLVMEIQDDGVGMPEAMAGSPGTVRKLRERAAVLGAGFSIHSKEDAGTCVRLTIHAKLLNTNPGTL